MASPVTQYSDPFIYNTLAINGSAGAALTLRQMIVALAGGVVPPVGVVAYRVIPAATVRKIGGYKPPVGGQAATFRPAVEGGGFVTVTSTGESFDEADPLDNVAWLADGVGATTMTVMLYTVGQVALR